VELGFSCFLQGRGFIEKQAIKGTDFWQALQDQPEERPYLF